MWMGSVFATLALGVAIVLPLLLPVEIPSRLIDSLPNTKLCFYALLACTFLSWTAALKGGKKSSKAAFIVSGFFSLLAVGFALEVAVYAGIFLDMAVPYLWHGIPHVLDHGFKDQCRSISQKAVLGKVVVEGCDHQCLYGLGQMAAMSTDAAVQIAFGSTPSVTVPRPQYNGLSKPPGVCLSDATFAQVEDLVKVKTTLVMVVVGGMVAVAFLELLAMLTHCLGLLTADAREPSGQEPLLQDEEPEIE